jgi:formylglycine-generating enzyme required for sulfatase activity
MKTSAIRRLAAILLFTLGLNSAVRADLTEGGRFTDVTGMDHPLTKSLVAINQKGSTFDGNGFVFGPGGCYVATNLHVALTYGSNPDGTHKWFYNSSPVEFQRSVYSHQVEVSALLDSAGTFRKQLIGKVISIGSYNKRRNSAHQVGHDIAILKLINPVTKQPDCLPEASPVSLKKYSFLTVGPLDGVATIHVWKTGTNQGQVFLSSAPCRTVDVPLSGAFAAECASRPGASGSIQFVQNSNTVIGMVTSGATGNTRTIYSANLSAIEVLTRIGIEDTEENYSQILAEFDPFGDRKARKANPALLPSQAQPSATVSSTVTSSGAGGGGSTRGTSTGGSASRAAGDRWKDCANCPELVRLPAGRFVMGSPDSEIGRDLDEGPVRTVTMPAGLAVGRTAVTRGEFAAFVAATGYRTEAENGLQGSGCTSLSRGTGGWRYGSNWRDPDLGQGDDHPVVCVSWNDAQQYVAWLNRSSGVTGWRLLTESEYEYAARAGSTTRFAWGNDEASQCAHANGTDAAWRREMPSVNWPFAACDDGFAFTAPVGRFRANGFGLFDMNGNSWSWVQDCYVDSYRSAPSDSSAVESGACSRRVLRGGGWFDNPQRLRSAYRDGDSPGNRNVDTGFRVARTLR